MKAFFIESTFACILITVALCHAAAELTNFRLVATADGKAFFADDGRKNWTESKELCEQTGLKLAKITTVNQKLALDSKYDEAKFEAGHWIAGRDAQEFRQFSWDDTGDEVALPNVTLSAYPSDMPLQTCIFYWPRNPSSLYYASCSFMVQTLCEIDMACN